MRRSEFYAIVPVSGELYEELANRLYEQNTELARRRVVLLLQEIRQEIDKYLYDNEFGSAYRADVASIIDKHIAEEQR